MERGAIVLQDFGEKVEASKLIQSSKMRALSFTTLARNLLDLGVTYKETQWHIS
jgi:hypothetical protein